jgi:NADH:ubiquinone oxidoreductase subunit 5 (subunit L)/multisubunit Na+/H+ antiporter MnhA subunit
MFFSVFAGPTARRRRFEPERIRDPGGRIRAGMVALALFAVAVGLFDLARVGPEFVRFVIFPGQKVAHAVSLGGSVLTAVAALLGLAVAVVVYGRRALPASRITGFAPWIPRAFSRAFYIGDAYRWGTENALLRAGIVADWVDRVVIDGAADRVGGGVAGVTGPSRWAPSARIPQLALGAFAGLVLLAVLAGAVLGRLKL